MGYLCLLKLVLQLMDDVMLDGLLICDVLNLCLQMIILLQLRHNHLKQLHYNS